MRHKKNSCEFYEYCKLFFTVHMLLLNLILDLVCMQLKSIPTISEDMANTSVKT